MRPFFPAAVIALVLAGFTISNAKNTAPINLKQLVQNQIAQIKARGIKQTADLKTANNETGQVEKVLPAAQTNGTQADGTELKTQAAENQSLEKKEDFEHKANLALKKVEEEKERSEKEKASSSEGSLWGETSDGLFLKIFILVDILLASMLFVFWRRRQQKIGMAEKAKLKKNIIKLRTEALFRRRAKDSHKDEVRKKLQLDPLCDTEDSQVLMKHAKKLSVPAGELMLASKLRSLERAHE